MDNESLTWENWRQAIIYAIDTLPQEFKDGLGWSYSSEKEVVITIATDWGDGDGAESDIQRIIVKWWDTVAELHDSRDKDESLEKLYGVDGLLAVQRSWPVISVFTESQGLDEGYYPNRIGVRGFVRNLRATILEGMFDAGVVRKGEGEQEYWYFIDCDSVSEIGFCVDEFSDWLNEHKEP